METFRVISLGAGVQSTTVYLMAMHGEFEHTPEVAIFADTQAEPRAVYEHLEWLRSLNGIPIEVVTGGDLAADVLKHVETEGESRVANPPFFVRNREGHKGILRRQCTTDYKIAPLERKMRELADGRHIEKWMGISLDEVARMRMDKRRRYSNFYPLIERRMSRWDCYRWLDGNGYPIPPRSACTFCPFHSDDYWRHLRDEWPEEWDGAIEFDHSIRDFPGTHGQVYLHNALVPLDEVDLRTPENHGQLSFLHIVEDFSGECEGMCGV